MLLPSHTAGGLPEISQSVVCLSPNLYERLGGVYSIATVVDDLDRCRFLRFGEKLTNADISVVGTGPGGKTFLTRRLEP